MTQKGRTDRKIAGIVIPMDWDDEQRIVEVAIATADEKEYRVKKTQKGRELFGCLQAYVEVTGSISENKNGEMMLTVKQYELKRPGDMTS